jgi:imidazolonepropionase-like amidohydrolase
MYDNFSNPLHSIRIFLLLSIFFGCFLSDDARSEIDQDEIILIRGGWLIDPINQERRENKGIMIKNGLIISIESDIDHPENKSSRIINLTESQTLIPGMIDMHAHYNFDLVDLGRVEEMNYNGIIFLANGVTSTWSAGEYYPERVIEQRDRIDSGERIGPRIFNSGPYFGAFRCEYNIKTAKDDCIAWPNDITEQEIRNEVNTWARKGVISIKIKQASPGEAKIIIEQAHRNGMTTAGHLGNYYGEYDVDLRDAILMGIDRVEHQITLGNGGERSKEMDQMIKLMINDEVYYDPNLQMYGGINLRKDIPDLIWTDESIYFTPYTQYLLDKRGDPPPESEKEEFNQRVIELISFYNQGGQDLILVGTDEPVYTSLLPGFAYHRELYAMQYFGIPTMSVIQAATINAARALGLENRLGSIDIGKEADILIINGDPISDIRNLRNIELVMKEGVIYDPIILLNSAQNKIGPESSEDHHEWELKIDSLRQ